MKLFKYSIPVALAIICGGCASDRAEVVEGPASNVDRIEIRNNYIPVYYTPHTEWGVERFVPGYARQGVIVTPSRVWTYGQGPGFRTRDARDINQMTGWDAQPCDSIDPVSQGERLRLGKKYINLGRPAVLNQPFSAAEQNKLAEYQQNGCDINEGARLVRIQRWRGVLQAREFARIQSAPVVNNRVDPVRVEAMPLHSDRRKNSGRNVPEFKASDAAPRSTRALGGGISQEANARESVGAVGTHRLEPTASPTVRQISSSNSSLSSSGKNPAQNRDAAPDDAFHVGPDGNTPTWDYRGDYPMDN